MTPLVRHIRPEAPLPALRLQVTPRDREDGRGAKCLYGSPKGGNSGQTGEPIKTLRSAIYGQIPPFHYRHLGTARVIAAQNQRGVVFPYMAHQRMQISPKTRSKRHPSVSHIRQIDPPSDPFVAFAKRSKAAIPMAHRRGSKIPLIGPEG